MGRKRDKTGRSLEKVVASIERALANNPNVSVESPRFLKDRLTGEDREHDVLLTIRSAHHTLMVSIECRDRSRKITVNDIEGFWAKCQHTGVDQGVVVSPKGFTRTALRKSTQLGLRCLLLAEVPSFNWLLAPGLVAHNCKIRHTNWIFFADPDYAQKPASFTILDPDGAPIDPQALAASAYREFGKIPQEDMPAGPGMRRILFNDPRLQIRDDETGEIRDVRQAVAEVEFEVEETMIPFDLSSYSSGHDGELITDVAAAEIDFGEIKGKIMIVYNQTKGGQVVFVPNRDEI